jgi:hypothetical protein
MSKPPVYHALSYTWGATSANYEIKLNNRPCTISQNLLLFVLQMSEGGFDGYF